MLYIFLLSEYSQQAIYLGKAKSLRGSREQQSPMKLLQQTQKAPINAHSCPLGFIRYSNIIPVTINFSFLKVLLRPDAKQTAHPCLKGPGSVYLSLFFFFFTKDFQVNIHLKKNLHITKTLCNPSLPSDLLDSFYLGRIFLV